MRTKALAVLGAAIMSVTPLAACGGDEEGGSASEKSCTNKILKPDAERVTLWAWYPAFEEVVDLYNKAHDDVQVCWTNAGQGNDEYTKFSTAIEAGSGAPDVIMIEAESITSFAIREALVDLSEYGANEVEGDYTEGSWTDVSSGDAVYAIPVDGGPMGMMYRKDIFDKYKVDVPETWDEFADTAQQLKDAGFKGVITDFPTNGRAYNQALFDQRGSEPYEYDLAEPQDISIDLDDQASKDVLKFWYDLIDRDLVATDDAFTTDWNASLVDGSYATYIGAAWGPGYLAGLENADSNAVWRAAPVPQWDLKNPVQINWGGSTFAVTSQADDKEKAAQVAKEIFATEEAWKIGIEKAQLFPLWTPILESAYYENLKNPFFDGQQSNKEVFLPAADAYEGFTFSPFQNFAYDKLTEELFAAAEGEKTTDQAVEDLQQAVVEYAKSQQFSVTEE